jgi:3alpha(or 20beta)-hydroxysteroid dehydrogenase
MKNLLAPVGDDPRETCAVTENRVALVTGAARGQGLAILCRLRKDGVQVAAGDVLVDELRRACAELDDIDVLPLALDVTSDQSWHDAVAAVEDRFGGLNVLVNNAGYLGPNKWLDESVEGFERQWRVNTLGPFLGIQAALPLLMKAESPAIVNTLSVAAYRSPGINVGYTASKWATRGLHQTAASELARQGIRVNAVLPGPIATPMLDDASIVRLGSTLPLGRIGTAQDIAEVVAFLASPAADFLAGSEVIADGGYSLQTPH